MSVPLECCVWYGVCVCMCTWRVSVPLECCVWYGVCVCMCTWRVSVPLECCVWYGLSVCHRWWGSAPGSKEGCGTGSAGNSQSTHSRQLTLQTHWFLSVSYNRASFKMNILIYIVFIYKLGESWSAGYTCTKHKYHESPATCSIVFDVSPYSMSMHSVLCRLE